MMIESLEDSIISIRTIHFRVKMTFCTCFATTFTCSMLKWFSTTQTFACHIRLTTPDA